MKSHFAFACLTLLLLNGCETESERARAAQAAQAERAMQTERSRLAMFQKRDRNGDGFIIKSELTGPELPSGTVRYVSTLRDSSGQIIEQDFLGGWDAGRAKNFIKIFDSNGDGKVSQEEFVHPNYHYEMGTDRRPHRVPGRAVTPQKIPNDRNA